MGVCLLVMSLCHLDLTVSQKENLGGSHMVGAFFAAEQFKFKIMELGSFVSVLPGKGN